MIRRLRLWLAVRLCPRGYYVLQLRVGSVIATPLGCGRYGLSQYLEREVVRD